METAEAVKGDKVEDLNEVKESIEIFVKMNGLMTYVSLNKLVAKQR